MIIADEQRIRDCTERCVWRNTLLGDWLDHNAATAPDREAVVDPPNRRDITDGPVRRLTWRDLADATDRLAFTLLEAGLRKDDVAVVQLANTWELLAVYLACAKVGVIVAPVPALYRRNELRYIAHTTRARALICASRIKTHGTLEMMLALSRECPSVGVVMAFGDSVAGEAVDLTSRLSREPDLAQLAAYARRNPISPNDVVNVLWTSGTEGYPKGVARSHNDWTFYADIFAEQFGIGDGCRLLAGRQLVTCGSFTAYIVPWLANAGTIVCHHPFDLELFIRQLEGERITFTSLAPAILHSLAEDIERVSRLDLSHLRYVSSGSAPLPSSVVSTLESCLGFRIVNIFGSTEGACLTSFPEDVPDASVRGSHFPRRGQPCIRKYPEPGRLQEVRLVDPGTETEITIPGQVGEMRYRGPMVFTGYYNAAQMNAAAFDREGYYRSGDLFEIAGDRGQYYRFVGRSKDIVVRGGMNVSAAELEDVILAHPAVRDCAVVGYPDERLGERVCAFVVLADGAELSLDALSRFLREEKQVAVFKLPERLVAVPALPRSPVGKVLKRALRDQVATAGAGA